jgi:hypothetical protein
VWPPFAFEGSVTCVCVCVCVCVRARACEGICSPFCVLISPIKVNFIALIFIAVVLSAC